MSTWGELEDVLYRAITGGRSPRTEDFHQAVGELRRQVPSTAEMARRLGVPRRTVGDWLLKRRTPTAAHRQTVMEALRRHRLRLGRERRLRKGDLVVVVLQRYDDGRAQGQQRIWHHPAQSPYQIDWDPRANGRILDRYLDGDMRGAAEAFIAGIGDPDYQEMTSPDNDYDPVGFDVEQVSLERPR